MKKYHGYTKKDFLLCCSRNIIFQVPYEQDHLLLNYGHEIGQAILNYLNVTTKDNLEMIYQNQFEFKMSFDETNRVCHMKFDYLH
ncbi:hypothetical protein OIV57_31170 [Burkholderia pseudomallei]|uniref:hypothetical protein n=1 Tax=Burkholderia pseudomallei TaxID=28450 RepID=UPI0021F6F5C0|nr:hypothetical protein [Burkholderia pseudomallei]MCV9916586.1 hypothetical protein [Burkholderia pseudomallei]MCW0070037.1 hypothetical protein [Burkholderia pseudomallei]